MASRFFCFALLVAYGLRIEIAVQVWNVMHQMPQKTTAPNSSGELFCADQISKDLRL